MGDPKKIRKKYETPRHPWIKSRIEEERKIRMEFGTRNKKEIWKMETTLKNFKTQAKNLIVLKTKQSELETNHLFRKMKELGLIKGEVSFDTILGLSLHDLMARRLQTLVFKKGMARTVSQARQFVVHEHILVNGKKITSPSYIVSFKEESTIEFSTKSSLYDEMHPERALPEVDLAEKKVVEKDSKKPKTEKVAKKAPEADDGKDLTEEKTETKEESKVEEKSKTEAQSSEATGAQKSETSSEKVVEAKK